ncbi:MAG: HPF/RaiA family ribosome-associated protein [Kiloniellaceae bacterium]
MQVPLEVTFHNMDRSEAVEANIRDRAAKLERHFGRIIGCRVVVEAPHRHRRKGKLFHVRIDLSVPGRELVVNRSGSRNPAHEDVYVAVRDAFNAAARQLEDHARKVRGEVKTHEAPLHGKVARLFPSYGFVETADGREIYFHKNSVVNGQFDQLEVGREVRLVLAHGESAEGPQASTVTPIGKHHIVA